MSFNTSGSGGDSGKGGTISLLQRMLPKEAKALMQCLRPTAAGDHSPGDSSPQIDSPRGTTNTEASLSPKHRRQLCKLALHAKTKVKERFEEGTRRSSWRFWAILVSTAVLSSLLSYSIDQATWVMGTMRHRFTNVSNYPQLAAVLLFNVTGVCLARLLVRTTVEAEGSGFPEVKAMLFGKVMLSYLTPRVLFVKAVALALGVGAGLPLGKEGPNVHMAACISRFLGPDFYENRRGRSSVAGTHLLLAACAVGVGASFSAPIGGVVFSLELVLPQVFDYIGYTGCFLSAVTGSICFASYRTWTAGATGLLPLMSSNVLPNEGALSEYPSAMILLDIVFGAFCGLLGGIWIRCHAKVVGAMKRWRLKSQEKRLLSRVLSIEQGSLARTLLDDSPKASGILHAVSQRVANPICQWRDLFQIAVVVTANTVFAAGLPLLGGRPQPALLSVLFDKDLLANEGSWSVELLGPYWTMVACFFFKWTITIVSLSLPNPAGVVAPTMIIGGLLGRCVGMALPHHFVHRLLQTPDGEVSEDAYGAFMARLAIVGAAAFCAAVCRAFAMAITVFEVLALPNAILPLCSASLAAIFVANRIALPYFDTNLVGRGLGGISALTHTKKAMDPAFNIMRRIDTRIDCIEERTTVAQLRRMFQESEEDHFPIVQHVVQHWADEGVTGILKGSISRVELRQIIERYAKSGGGVEVDFNDPDTVRPANGSKPLVRCAPMHVSPETHVQDVYLLMKITHEQVVYVTRDNCLLGVINFKELLGHKLND
eukprot:CAMPEP_0179021976 /NCGR_PEP_ID=MMETSP0796-20121207/6169_1 /TAXON_ID=73915 /ORGANISM="Pyrodinium bahamense, Strain pbaha01" /LENGTH=768 /DNA_ID=CAMNT_0020717827 /DNA_START=12 /DNA_END=2318 /DNA_ORIENTATION=+